jgi:hypothetical protein
MKLKLIIATAVATALAVAAAAAASDSGSAKTTRYGVKFVTDTQIDLGARGPSVGDLRTFYDVLYDRSGKRVGYGGGVCAVESLDPPVFSCTVTFWLPGGEIATQFLTTPGPAPKPLAVTGGTGTYRGVRGDATLVEFGKDKGDTGTVTFRLTK